MDNQLNKKAFWVRKEMLKIHRTASETRIASCLSDVEIFTALYYGNILNFDSKNSDWKERDRLIVSKAHGALSLYPILADLGYFDKGELSKVCQEGSFLGGIPDTTVPGFETINGALGHGLGVACGMAFALKEDNSDSKVFVLSGDGELYEGAVWEAVMFAAEHKLDNLILIVDKNRISMLDYCEKIIDLDPYAEKFKTFNWSVEEVDGHDVEALAVSLASLKKKSDGIPKVLIAKTVKGKGVPRLENDHLCHIKSLKEEEINELLKDEY